MTLDPWTLALQALNALVLVWLLSRFLFRPVARAIATRREAIAAELDAAEAARRGAEAEEARAREAREAIERERAAALEASGAEASAQRERLLAETRGEIDALHEAAREAHAAERHELSALYEREAAALALDIAARVLARLPEEVRVMPFVEPLAAAVAALPARTRERLGRDETLALHAPRVPSVEEAARLDSALADAFGHEIALEMRVDASLVAGLELEGAHCAVRNSVRSDLARVAESLRQAGVADA